MLIEAAIGHSYFIVFMFFYNEIKIPYIMNLKTIEQIPEN